jgi:hypothetical protein
MRSWVLGAATALALAVAVSGSFADKASRAEKPGGRPEKIVWAKAPTVLASYSLPAGKSVVPAVRVSGYSQVRLQLRGKGIMPREVVNVGLRFGPVGDELRGDYEIQREIAPTMVLGDSAMDRTEPVLGPILYLSFENKAGHAVAISALVNPMKKSVAKTVAVLRSYRLGPGATVSREVPASGYAKAGVQVFVQGLSKGQQIHVEFRSCPVGAKPSTGDLDCEMSQSLPKSVRDKVAYVGKSLVIEGNRVLVRMDNHGDSPVTVDAGVYLTK